MAGGGLRPASPLVGVLVALGVYTALQALPLPRQLLELVSPMALLEWDRSLALVGQPEPAWVTISLDPGATFREVLKCFSYAGVLLMASYVTRIRGPRFVLWCVFGCCLAMAALDVLHGLVRATKVYGIYTPSLQSNRWSLAPLLNENTFAAYLNLGIFCGLGLGLAERRGAVRAGIALLIAVTVAISVLSGSRGGLLSLLLGGLAFALLIWARRDSLRSYGIRRREALLLGLAGMGAGSILVFIGLTRSAWSGLSDERLDKLQWAEWALPMIRDFPAGVGRGAVGSVFPAYRPAASNDVILYMENFVLQWVTEWGPIVAGLVLLVVGAQLSPRHLRGNPGQQVAALGVFVVLIHNLVDLGLEVPALCYAMLAVIGACWSHPRSPRWKNVAWERGLLVGLLVACVLVGWRGRSTLGGDRNALHSRLAGMAYDDSDQVQALSIDLDAAVRRRPADPYLALIQAFHAERRGHGSTLAWLGRAVQRNPSDGVTHLAIARAVFRRGGTAQALLELRTAAGLDPALVTQVVDQARRWSKDPEELNRIVPLGAGRAQTLTRLANSFPDHEASYRWLKEAESLSQDVAPPKLALAYYEIKRMRAGDKEHCGDDLARCAKAAGKWLDLAKSLPGADESYIYVRASLIEITGSPLDADALLAGGCGDHRTCHRIRVNLAVKHRLLPSLQEAAERYVGRSCDQPEPCAAAHGWLGRQYSTLGEHGKALTHLVQAAERRGTAARWLDVAAGYAAAGSAVSAVQSLERAKSFGADPQVVAERRSRYQGLARP